MKKKREVNTILNYTTLLWVILQISLCMFLCTLILLFLQDIFLWCGINISDDTHIKKFGTCIQITFWNNLQSTLNSITVNDRKDSFSYILTSTEEPFWPLSKCQSCKQTTTKLTVFMICVRLNILFSIYYISYSFCSHESFSRLLIHFTNFFPPKERFSFTVFISEWEE